MKTDVLIVGGGMTGLSFASFTDKDYILLEKDSELGGYCKTIIRNGFVWDYSGHFFHFNHEDIKNYLIENIDCEILKVDKISNIYYKGQYIDFPFQSNIDQLPKDEFIECLHDIYHLKEKDTSSFKSYVKSNLGDAICDKFVIPYNEKLYACDLDLLDSNSMGRFFPKTPSLGDLLKKMKSNEKVKSYNDSFIYPVKGSFEFVKSLIKRIDESKVLTNTELISVDLKNKIAKTSKGDIQFNSLVSTIPFDKLLKLSNNKVNLQKLSSNKVAVFNLGFNKGSDLKSHWTYFPGNEVFYRVGFYNNILGQDKLSLYVEIGLKTTDIINEQELLDKVLIDLHKCGVIKNHTLVDHEFIVMNPAYVHITEESNQIYKEWCEENNPNGIFSIGRYGSWTYCSIEDNIVQAKTLTNKL